MAGQSKDIELGNENFGLVGGPLGGPGRPGKALVTPQQAMGDYTGPGVPTTPFRGSGMPQTQSAGKNNPKSPFMKEGK